MHCDEPWRRPPERSVDCEQLEEGAREADEAVLDAIQEPRGGGELVRVRVEGVVRDGDALAPGAAVRAWIGLDEAGVVRTGPAGTYALEIMVEPDECAELSLVVTEPGGRRGEPIAPVCGEQILDYDFASESWVRRSGGLAR